MAESLKQFITSINWIQLIVPITTACLGYYLALRKQLHNRSIPNQEKLLSIYMELYQRKHNIKTITHQELVTFYNFLSLTIENDYKYLPPKIIALHKQLGESLAFDERSYAVIYSQIERNELLKIYTRFESATHKRLIREKYFNSCNKRNECYSKINHHINTEYYRLRRKLGLPSSSFIHFVIHFFSFAEICRCLFKYFFLCSLTVIALALFFPYTEHVSFLRRIVAVAAVNLMMLCYILIFLYLIASFLLSIVKRYKEFLDNGEI